MFYPSGFALVSKIRFIDVGPTRTTRCIVAANVHQCIAPASLIHRSRKYGVDLTTTMYEEVLSERTFAIDCITCSEYFLFSRGWRCLTDRYY